MSKTASTLGASRTMIFFFNLPFYLKEGTVVNRDDVFGKNTLFGQILGKFRDTSLNIT